MCYNDAVEEPNMDKMLKAETQANAASQKKIDYKAEIAKMFAHMDIVSERIKRNQLETEKLQAETRVMLAEIQAEMKAI